MNIHVFKDADRVAAEGAAFIAAAARSVLASKGKFIFAVSGGHTPWVMLRALAKQDLPWADIHVLQVDERVAPADSQDRNLAHLRENLLAHAPLPPENIHAMPVEADDLAAAAKAYARTLEELAGSPPGLDLIHLGLGPDGHTASLVPADRVLDAADALVATTGLYQGRRRMTLTFPVLNRAHAILFVVTGAEKVDALSRLSKHDPTIPAGRVRAENIVVMADEAAAAGL